MKKKMKISLLAGAIVSFGIMAAVTLVFMVLSFFTYKDYVNTAVWRGFMAAGILLLLLALLCFLWYVYRPVRKLREAILRLEATNPQKAMELWASADSMAGSIDALLEELRLSMEREHAEVLLRQQSQYAELQNQINPHFLYNTLETIRGQAVIDDNYKIADMTEALAKYFRYNISRDNDIVTVAQELENIRNYIQIQQYRFQERFVFRIYPHVEEEEYAGCLMPKMTLQPIVENAIYHGMEEKLELGHISIHIEADTERLVILVVDDGVGMEEDTLQRMNRELLKAEMRETASEKTSHNGIAMQNINSRLRILYGEAYGLRVSSTKDLGTEVEITLPRLTAEE